MLALRSLCFLMHIGMSAKDIFFYAAALVVEKFDDILALNRLDFYSAAAATSMHSL